MGARAGVPRGLLTRTLPAGEASGGGSGGRALLRSVDGARAAAGDRGPAAAPRALRCPSPASPPRAARRSSSATRRACPRRRCACCGSLHPPRSTSSDPPALGPAALSTLRRFGHVREDLRPQDEHGRGRGRRRERGRHRALHRRQLRLGDQRTGARARVRQPGAPARRPGGGAAVGDAASTGRCCCWKAPTASPPRSGPTSPTSSPRTRASPPTARSGGLQSRLADRRRKRAVRRHAGGTGLAAGDQPEQSERRRSSKRTDRLAAGRSARRGVA